MSSWSLRRRRSALAAGGTVSLWGGAALAPGQSVTRTQTGGAVTTGEVPITLVMVWIGGALASGFSLTREQAGGALATGLNNPPPATWSETIATWGGTALSWSAPT